jgi:hypothetical protein
MIPTARVQRGPSEVARCASKRVVPTPGSFFNILITLLYIPWRRDRYRMALIVEIPYKARAWPAGLWGAPLKVRGELRLYWVFIKLAY